MPVRTATRPLGFPLIVAALLGGAAVAIEARGGRAGQGGGAARPGPGRAAGPGSCAHGSPPGSVLLPHCALHPVGPALPDRKAPRGCRGLVVARGREGRADARNPSPLSVPGCKLSDLRWLGALAYGAKCNP